MLEYLAYKKYKARRDRSSSPSGIVSEEQGPSDMLALDVQDESFLESSLASSQSQVGLLSGLGARMRSFRGTIIRDRSSPASEVPEKVKDKGKHKAENTHPNNSIVGQGRPEDAQNDLMDDDDPIADASTQRTQIQKVLDAFNLSLATRSQADDPQRSFSERARDQFAVSTINTKTKELLSEFMQVLKDIQNGVPLAGHDLQTFFERHTRDLKSANDSVPSFIKTLIFKLLPISTIPSLEELSKPGALMGLIKGVFQVLKGRFPAFVGGSALMVMAVVIVMLGVWYAFKRGREERELLENPEGSRVAAPAFSGTGQQGRQVEISVDGVRYVTVLDEDGMRVPVPEDDRGIYWDRGTSVRSNQAKE